MDNLLKVTILDTGDDLMEEIPCLIGGQTSFRDNVIKQFSTRHVLIDKENVGRGVDDFVQPNDVRVCTQMQNVDFPLYFFFHPQLFDLGLVQNLDRNLVSCHSMSGQFDLEEKRTEGRKQEGRIIGEEVRRALAAPWNERGAAVQAKVEATEAEERMHRSW